MTASLKTIRHSSAAFTLIELILGLGIFTAMAASLYLTYTNAIRIDREASGLSALYQEGYWTMAALEEDMESLTHYRYVDRLSAAEGPILIGNADSMEFLVEGKAELQWISYALRAPEASSITQTRMGQRTSKNVDQLIEEQRITERQAMLTRAAVPFRGEAQTGKEQNPYEILTDHITEKDLRFSYAEPNLTDGQLSWQDEWHRREPPAAVRIALRVKDERSGTDLELTKDILVPLGLELRKDTALPDGRLE